MGRSTNDLAQLGAVCRIYTPGGVVALPVAYEDKVHDHVTEHRFVPVAQNYDSVLIKTYTLIIVKKGRLKSVGTLSECHEPGNRNTDLFPPVTLCQPRVVSG